MLNTSRASPWSIPAKHKSSDAQISLGRWNTLGATHTAHNSHSKSHSVFIKQKYFGSIKMKAQELGSRSREFPSRPGHQARELSPVSVQAKAEPGQACSLFLLIPVPLGHPLVEKPDICRNAEGVVSTETEGAKTKVRVARIIQDDLQAMKCLNLHWNVNTNCLMLIRHKYVLNSQFQQIVHQEFRRSHLLLITPNKKNFKGRCEHRSKQK